GHRARLQHRPAGGVGAGQPARPGRGHGAQRAEPHREPRRAHARRLREAQRRGLAQAHAGDARGRREPVDRLQARDHHPVPAQGAGVLMSRLTLRILRYNPETDEVPYYREYGVEVEPTDRVLDVLNAVKWYQDGAVTYRRSCAHGICGSDAMRINGVNRLACKVLVRDVLPTRKKGRGPGKPLTITD